MLGNPKLAAFPGRPPLCGPWKFRIGCSGVNQAGSEERHAAEEGVESETEAEVVAAGVEEAPGNVVGR